jgi:predicted phage terminase large subunit-like protein
MSSENARKLLEARREQWHRLCRQSLLACAKELLEPMGFAPAEHHRLFCHEIEAVVHGQNPRLILIAPRGSAKSTYASHIAPAWLFAMRPNARILAVSHTQDHAEKNSRTVMRFVRDNAALLGYELANDAAGYWSTTNGGEYRAVGVGQPARGLRADLILVDDPISSSAEARSETERESLWEYFHSDLTPCLLPRGGIVLIATCYHENDLLCRLEREYANLWRVLRLPAISEGADVDPLGRPEGTPLWHDDLQFGYGVRLLELQAELAEHGRSHDWASQYQGRPRPREGTLFTPAMMPVFDALPPNTRIINETRAWDLASSAGRGDYTACVKLVRLAGDPRWKDTTVIVDVQRVRVSVEAVRALIRTVAEADGRRVTQWFPCDPGQAGRFQAEDLIRMLAGFTVKTERMTGSKITRAEPAACQLNIGQVGMLRAPWNAVLQDELAAFPHGAHDDMVDAFSLAFDKTAGRVSDRARWLALAS